MKLEMQELDGHLCVCSGMEQWKIPWIGKQKIGDLFLNLPLTRYMSLGKVCSLFGTQIPTFVRWKDCVRWSLSSLPALIFFDLKICMLACLLSRFSRVWLFSTLWLHNPSPPGSSLHGILQARILEWVAMPSSRASSQPRDWTHVSYISCTGRQIRYQMHHLGSPKLAICIHIFPPSRGP